MKPRSNWRAVGAAIALAGTLTGAGPVAAQRLAPPRFVSVIAGAAAAVRPRPPAPLPATTDEEVDPFRIGAAALLGGVVGGAAGGFVGYHLSGGSRLCGDDDCGLFGGMLGLIIGEPVGMGVAAHVANGRRGNALLDILGAAGTGYLVLAAAGRADGSGAIIVAAAAVQIAATVAIERGTGRARSP